MIKSHDKQVSLIPCWASLETLYPVLWCLCTPSLEDIGAEGLAENAAFGKCSGSVMEAFRHE